MNPIQPNEEQIFSAARRIPDVRQQHDYLHAVCGEDEPLLLRVQALLRVYAEEQHFLESPLAGAEETTSLFAPIESVGTVGGLYRLLEQLGSGGMGVVYLAQQEQPIPRQVALKIIKPGMDTRDVIARFEAERQSLAMMDHPNIARMLDAGTTDGGRPYFVMELIRGIPITHYCDEVRLSVRDRLNLFISVCEAVQHAHQKGIIHRDIKPGNVLIQSNMEYPANPIPKVIDFGISKAVHGRLSESKFASNILQIVGTPAYMSPEQTRMNDQEIDTRTDIYSLGVLLYELLTGTCPFDRLRLRDAGYEEFRRIICEEDPPQVAAHFRLRIRRIDGFVKRSLCLTLYHHKSICGI